MIQCGNKADWKCVRVILGMGEADCDVASNFHLNHSQAFALWWWLKL